MDLFIYKDIPLNTAFSIYNLGVSYGSSLSLRVSVYREVIRRYLPFLPEPSIKNNSISLPEFEEYVSILAVEIKRGSVFLEKDLRRRKFLDHFGIPQYMIASALSIKDKPLHNIEDVLIKSWNAANSNSKNYNMSEIFTFLGKIDVDLANDMLEISQNFFKRHYIGFVRNINYKSLAIAVIINRLNQLHGWDLPIILDVDNNEISFYIDTDFDSETLANIDHPMAINFFNSINLDLNTVYSLVDNIKLAKARLKMEAVGDEGDFEPTLLENDLLSSLYINFINEFKTRIAEFINS